MSILIYRFNIILFKISVILFIIVSFSYSQTTIAVLEFDTKGIGNVTSSALSAIVRREIMKSDQYRLVNRRVMDEILTEQGFSQTGCVTSECAVEVGKLLGVQKMMTGSLSGLGSLYLLDIQIIDVTTGQVEQTETVEYIGKVEELITPLREATKKMISGVGGVIGGTFIYVQSSPSGAQIYVNDNFVGSSPLKYSVKNKSYKITLKAPGYTDWSQTVKGKEGETVIVRAEMFEIKASEEQGITKGEGVAYWEILQMNRNEYIEFMRLGIQQQDWIDTYQPIGLLVNDLIMFKSANIPEDLWLDFKRLQLTPAQYIRLVNLKIDPEKWLSEYLPGGLTLDEIEEFQKRKIAPNLWIYVKSQALLDSSRIAYLQSLTPDLILHLIGIGTIDRSEHQELMELAGNHFLVLIRVSHLYLYEDFDSSMVSDDATRFMSRILYGEDLSQQTIHAQMSSWKQSILNSLPEDSRYDHIEWVKSLSAWEWLVTRKFNISNEDFLVAAGKL